MRQFKIAKHLTNRESISLDKYLLEISKIDLVTADEEVELAKRIRNGDKDASEKMIKANLRFVISVAKQYQNQGLSLPDLINEGNLGLIKAAQRFDETKGFKFISYGVWWIRQSILEALTKHARIVRLPLNKISFISRITKAFTHLEQEYHWEPTSDEVAFILNISAEVVEEALKVPTRHISLDAPICNEEEGDNLFDVLLNEDSTSPDQDLMNTSLCKEIERTLCTLKQREADIIRYYFGLSNNHQLSLEEIGDKFSLTRERARQIKERAIKKMRNNQGNKLLRAYL